MTIFGVGGVVEEEVWTSLSDYSLAPAGPLGPAKSWPLAWCRWVEEEEEALRNFFGPTSHHPRITKFGTLVTWLIIITS